MKTKPFNAARAWTVIAILVVVYAALYPLLSHHSIVVERLAQVGLIGAPCAAIIFTLIYTVYGLRGRAKWWTDDVGMTVVTPYLAMIFSNGVIAWATVFKHGEIRGPTAAWIYIGGLLAAMGFLAWRCVVWVTTRQRLQDELKRDEGEK